MKRKNRWTKLIFAVLLAMFFAPTSLFAQTKELKKPDQKILDNARDFLWAEKPLLALADAPFLALGKKSFAQGGDVEDIITDLLFPTSGRAKYVQFIPHFGKNKMYWRKLEWKKYETEHISLFVYDPLLRDLFISMVEENYTDLAKTFQTATFDEKMIITIYRDRRDFRQMNFGGIDPDDIGGVTHDLKKWHNKIAFLFEGSKSELFEVSRHEMVHRFNMEQIYHESGNDMLANPPLWFVEGTAVSYSIGWSTIYEWVARDAFYNDYLEYGILPEGRGTFLPYVTGTMVVNYIKENYGTSTINAIIKDSAELAGKKLPKDDEFDKILKKYTSLDAQGLYEKTVDEFKKRLKKSDDDIDVKSPIISEKSVVVAAHKNVILRLEGKYLRRRLYLSIFENGEIIKSKKFAVDGTNKTEELKLDTAALSDTHLAYVTFQSDKGTDVLRVAPYSVKDKKITIGKYREYSFPDIIFITSPAFVGKDEIAFVGLKNGFTNIYLVNLKTAKLKQLTYGTSYIGGNGMDYSPERNELVFSRESEERTDNPINKCDFNNDLYLLNLETLKETKVAETPGNESGPQWLNENQIIFVSAPTSFEPFGLSIYDFKAQRFISVGTTRITAISPKVLDENTVIFHSTKDLRSKPRLLELSSVPSAAPANVEINKLPSNAEIGNVVIKEGKLFVKQGLSLYPAERFTLLENNLYLEADTGSGKSTLFGFNKNAPENLAVSVESVNEKSAVVKFREENEVLWEGVSPSGNFAIFAVNNRLKWANQKISKDYPVSVHIYDVKAQKFTTKFNFAMKSTSGFGSITFLANEYALLAIGGKIILLNLEANEEAYLKNVKSIKISPNKELVAWFDKKSREKGKLYVFDTLARKEIKLGEYDEMENLNFNADNELVWSKETGKRWKDLAFNIYVWSPGLEEPAEIKVDVGKKSVFAANKKSVAGFKASSAAGAILLMKDDKTGKKSLYFAKPVKDGFATITSMPLLNLSGIFLQGLYKDHLFFAAVRNKKTRYYAYDLGSQTLVERIKPWNAATNGSQIVISSKKSIAVYDIATGSSEIFSDTAGFELKDSKLLYSKWTNGSNYDIFETDLSTKKTINLTQTPHRDETKPYYENNKISYSVTPVYKGESVAYVALPPSPNYSAGKVKKVKTKTKPFDVASGLGLGSIGFTGGQFSAYGYLDVHLYDLFEDSTMELYYLGGYNIGYNFAEISYLHRPSGNAARIYLNNYRNDYVTGLDYLHTFNINKFQRVTLNVGYKNQLLLNWAPGDYRGWSNVLNIGASYTLDTTRHMLHGPQDGFRFFISLNLGNNLDHNTLNNIDLNFAWRQYINICNLASFAYRFEAGASLGMAPTWFGMGGNMAMRGLSFASLWGNIYALGSAEIRLDLIYYAGAVLKEPLTPASVFFLAFMPQFGWYVDMGTAFYWNPLLDHPSHDERGDAAIRHVLEDWRYPPELYWSTGPFINLPYLPAGMILRFNWSVVGPYKGWNFWFGFNW
jgi:Tol biopolymer transport system component